MREKTAADLLGKYIPAAIETSVDPAMLLSAEEWDEVTSKNPVKDRYALVYFFSDSRAVRKRARAFCVRHGLRMIMIPYAKQEYNLTDAAGPGERIAKTGPREFVSLIRGAEFVLTDSFHGAVFSLIYKKPFVVFERNKSGHVSMNSRLYDLLALFEQSHRLIDLSLIGELDNLYEVETEKIEAILLREKARALTYLKKSIETAIAAADETAAK